jgi:hypothetical protein
MCLVGLELVKRLQEAEADILARGRIGPYTAASLKEWALMSVGAGRRSRRALGRLARVEGSGVVLLP